MNEDLRDVITAAVENGRRPSTAGSTRPAMQLHAVGADRPEAIPTASILRPLAAIQGIPERSQDDQLGSRGLRLGFWLCGFHDALVERQELGERLTEREASLLELSRKDFVDMRPLVITMAVRRLDEVVTSLNVLVDPDSLGASALGPLEAFTLDTVRNLSARASQLLQDHGPDMAISMFGGTGEVMEPLAIFQAVFATALGVIETFERIGSNGTKFLPRLTAALDSELERV